MTDTRAYLSSTEDVDRLKQVRNSMSLMPSCLAGTHARFSEQKAVHQARSQDKSPKVRVRMVAPGSMHESPTRKGVSTRTMRKEEDSEDEMLVSHSDENISISNVSTFFAILTKWS